MKALNTGLKNYIYISHFNKSSLSIFNLRSLFIFNKFHFTGKTETGWKFTTPTLKMISCKPVPPPGFNITIPEGWDVKKFFEKLGGDLFEHADKFESLKEIFDNSNSKYYALKELPTKQRKYLLRHITFMRRGLLTFDYLNTRTCVAPCRKLTKPIQKVAKKKKVVEEGPKSKTAASASGEKK